MNNFDHEFFQREASKSKATMPEELEKRFEKTLQEQTTVKAGFRRKISALALAATVMISLVFGSAYLSPTLANTLQSIPYIGVAFEMFGDDGFQRASEEQLGTEVNETFQIGDIEVTITEVIYDGVRLAVAYALHTGDDRSGDIAQLMDLFSDLEFRVDGERIGYASVDRLSDLHALDEHTVVGVLEMNTSSKRELDDLAEEFTLTISPGYRRSSTSFEWQIDVPVQLIDGVRTYWVFETKQADKQAIHVEKVTYGAATAGIQFEVAESIISSDVPTNDYLRFALYDDRGNELDFWGGSVGAYGYDDEQRVETYSYTFKPPQGIPTSLVLEPTVWPTDGSDPYVLDDLAIEFELDATVTEADRDEDPFGERIVDEEKHITHPENTDLGGYYDAAIIKTFDLDLDGYTL